MADLRERLCEVHPDVEVWAAGGVVLRERDGEQEVLLVHRPQRNDWSFPKGKQDEGESLGRTAEREVFEETGFRCARGERLPVVCYTDPKGREKLVVYWTMEVIDGRFEPNDEVDTQGWFTAAAARNLLTYPRDVDLLGEALPGDPEPRMSA